MDYEIVDKERIDITEYVVREAIDKGDPLFLNEPKFDIYDYIYEKTGLIIQGNNDYRLQYRYTNGNNSYENQGKIFLEYQVYKLTDIRIDDPKQEKDKRKKDKKKIYISAELVALLKELFKIDLDLGELKRIILEFLKKNNKDIGDIEIEFDPNIPIDPKFKGDRIKKIREIFSLNIDFELILELLKRIRDRRKIKFSEPKPNPKPPKDKMDDIDTIEEDGPDKKPTPPKDPNPPKDPIDPEDEIEKIIGDDDYLLIILIDIYILLIRYNIPEEEIIQFLIIYILIFVLNINIYELYDDNIKEKTEEEIEREIVARIDKKKRNLKPLALAGIPIALLGGLDKEPIVQSISIQEEIPESKILDINEQDITIALTSKGGEPIIKKIEIKEAVSDINMGDYLDVKDGDTFYTMGDLTGVHKTIGKEFNNEGKPAGKYKVTGFCIMDKNGNLLDYIENFDGNDNVKTNLGDFINETCNKHNISPEDVVVNIHQGVTEDITRLGWISADDKVNIVSTEKEIEENADIDIINIEASDFRGDTIGVATDDGKVVFIQIKDENGNFLKEGSTVEIDGVEYTISKLDVTEKTRHVQVPTTTYETRTEDKVVGSRLTFDFKQFLQSLLMVLPLGLGVVAVDEILKKLDKPQFESFEDDAEYQRFRREFISKRKKYEEGSAFYKLLHHRRWDELRKLTDEQVKKIYEIIVSTHNDTYSYDKRHKISMKTGKVIVTYPDGKQQDITHLILPKIKDIGKDNAVDEYGELPKDKTR